MSAGRMNRRLRFEQREVRDDLMGNRQADFVERFCRWAEIRPSLGIEAVTAARLAGEQPVDITVYRDCDTIDITPDWRAVDVYAGTIYALASPPVDLDQRGARLTIKAVSGIAA
jgi:head-tail adaptor